MKQTECIFCNKTREKAKEHIWPRWLQLNLYGDTKSQFDGMHISSNQISVLDKRQQTGETLIFGRICKICNNGWMSDLEEDFKPIFHKLIDDYKNITRLSKSERKTISCWSLKTAMMINAGSNYRQIIPIEYYNLFYLNQQIPKDIKIDIAFIKSDDLLIWEQSNFQFCTYRGTDQNYDVYHLKKNSFIIGMQLKSLGIKVSHYYDCKAKGYKIPISTKKSSVRIWPYLKSPKFNINDYYQSISEFRMDTVLNQ
jgi:hypothetical protein